MSIRAEQVAEAMERTNQRVKRMSRKPILGYLYHGRAYRVNASGFPNWSRTETISGVFRVIVRIQGNWVVGNGELPEGVWIIDRTDVHKVERAD